MGLRGRVITEPVWGEVTESFSDRKTRGQRREEVREPARWLPEAGRRNSKDSSQEEQHAQWLGGWRVERVLFKAQNGGG